MKKIISFCLWGDNPSYTHGAIFNARLANHFFEGWISRFYVAPSVPEYVTILLEHIENVEIVMMEEEALNRSMFWRFYPASEDDVDIMISRDTDSRLGIREKEAVDEWLASDKGFHIMRDHPYHDMPIMGGMWGARKGSIPEMRPLIDKHIERSKENERYGEDQNFLASSIFPLIKDDVFVHDGYGSRWRRNVSNYQNFDSHPFPNERNFNVHFHVPIFVGEQFDEKSKRLHPEYLSVL